MIPRAFRILFPCPVTVEQEQAEGGTLSPPPSANVSEHARLSANTAELWFALVARLTP